MTEQPRLQNILLDEEQQKVLATVHNRLVRTLAEGVSVFDPTKAAWDKVTWGRKSSVVDPLLARPIEFADELEASLDFRKVAT